MDKRPYGRLSHWELDRHLINHHTPLFQVTFALQKMLVLRLAHGWQREGRHALHHLGHKLVALGRCCGMIGHCLAVLNEGLTGRTPSVSCMRSLCNLQPFRYAN